jgi:hypothetical protein
MDRPREINMARDGKKWSRVPGVRIENLGSKLYFLYSGEKIGGPGDATVTCRYRFPFRNRRGMAIALKLGDAQLEGSGPDRDRISEKALREIGRYFGFDVTWPEWESGSAYEFAIRYNAQSTYGTTEIEPPSFDNLLAGLSLWVGQDITLSPDGARLWPVSFSFRSQPSPSVVPGIEIALTKVFVFIFARSDNDCSAIWSETYPGNYVPEGSRVTLRLIGTNTRPGRLIVAEPGNYIEAIELPHDFYRVSGLNEQSLIQAYAAAYSKHLEGNNAVAESTDEYSFSGANDGKAEPLLSIQQARLVKRLLEKDREYSMGPARPKLSPGWVLLHWAQRNLTRVSDEQG